MSKLISEVIRSRKSVRSYTDAKIEADKKNKILAEMNKVSNESFRFEFVDYTVDENLKVGSYGIVKGAKTFMVGILKKDLAMNKDIAVDFGYAFEKLILKATELGLGTCWLAGGYDSDKIGNVNNDENLVIVSPIGYATDKKRLIEKVGGMVIKSAKRKDWKDLFFKNNPNTILSKDDSGEYKDIFEAVRIGPSAINIQPWRIIKTNDSIDFYTSKSKSADKKGQKINFVLNDIGIAKCHFDLVAQEKGIEGKWTKVENPSNEFDYVVSFIKN